jgi:putative transposase
VLLTPGQAGDNPMLEPLLTVHRATTTGRIRVLADKAYSHPSTRQHLRALNRITIERGFNRLKHWRGIATRYDKYALTYLGGVLLAAMITHHRIRN